MTFAALLAVGYVVGAILLTRAMSNDESRVSRAPQVESRHVKPPGKRDGSS